MAGCYAWFVSLKLSSSCRRPASISWKPDRSGSARVCWARASFWQNWRFSSAYLARDWAHQVSCCRPPVGADLDIGDVVLQGLILRRLGTEVLRFLLELLGLLLELPELCLQLQAGVRRRAVFQHRPAQGIQLGLHGAVALLQAVVFLLQSGDPLLIFPGDLLDIVDHVLPVEAAE